MILAGDIGGTNTRLGFFSLEQDRLVLEAVTTYPSREYESLETIVQKFVTEQHQSVDSACLAVAGPVHRDRVSTTNLAWLVEAERLRLLLRTQAVTLINDLEAIAYGIPELEAHDLVTLQPGIDDASGNLAIIAAGTGLGQAAAFLDVDHGRHRPFACEGGHVDFAARSEREVELLRYMLARFERVSYERILSGSGLFAIYAFLHHTGQGDEDPALTETIYQQQHPAPIVRAALDGRSERCILALDLFVSLYGAEAGNLALKIMARGGMYIAGGIAPRIIERLRQPMFMEAFLSKGRMRSLLEAMPVKVILNDKVGLWGAARHAAGSVDNAGH